MTESTNSAKHSKDIFVIYKQNVDKMFGSIRQSVPQYHQAITNMQQECLQAFEHAATSAFEFQMDVTKKAGLPTSVPEATIRVIDDTVEEIAKASAINNQMVLATIDAAQQNVKTLNDNAKSFASLNRDILRSWISAFNLKFN